MLASDTFDVGDLLRVVVQACANMLFSILVLRRFVDGVVCMSQARNLSEVLPVLDNNCQGFCRHGFVPNLVDFIKHVRAFSLLNQSE